MSDPDPIQSSSSIQLSLSLSLSLSLILVNDRDLKSDNVFVTMQPDGTIAYLSLGDFDTAKSVGREAAAHSVVGTPGTTRLHRTLSLSLISSSSSSREIERSSNQNRIELIEMIDWLID